MRHRKHGIDNRIKIVDKHDIFQRFLRSAIVNVSGKWDFQGHNDEMHEKGKRHSQEHTECLKNWFLKNFDVTVDSFAVKTHHVF
ncbi:unnamed protein product [Pseudo-nitzschia multistriata]|uniref:Uncharacterized protein n=1 Tax=Pseudo-nitzschia multistriata TaxID=183589 RepID=A0A448Z9H9_9STRA|nr:unnamed protein product [Pseudo-nitzschia multistriata]